MYDASPKLKYIDVSHYIISWLKISGKLQPSLQIRKLTTCNKWLNLTNLQGCRNENQIISFGYRTLWNV